MATYGKRTGVTTLKKLVDLLCRLYTVYSKTIEAWVDTAVEPANRATVKAFLATISAVCAILDATMDD